MLCPGALGVVRAAAGVAAVGRPPCSETGHRLARLQLQLLPSPLLRLGRACEVLLIRDGQRDNGGHANFVDTPEVTNPLFAHL